MDGFVEKFVGDALMAVFGAPLAHEDDPQRAVRTALDMHEGANALSQRWLPRLGHPLTLHIGINSGRVVAGTIGSGPDAAFAVTGDTVNTAARLQSAAAAGQTLVSPATESLTRHEFSFEPGGSLSLKGKAEPVPVFRLLGSHEQPQALRGLAAHGLVAPLIGREGDSGAIAGSGTQGAGCPGSGSEPGRAGGRRQDAAARRLARASRLACPVQAGGRAPRGVFAAGPATLRRDCQPVPRSLWRRAFGTLDEARHKVEQCLRALGADDVELALVGPVVGHILGLQENARASEIEPERLKRQIFMSLRSMLERRLAHGPAVLVVEDLQWADAASIEGFTHWRTGCSIARCCWC